MFVLRPVLVPVGTLGRKATALVTNVQLGTLPSPIAGLLLAMQCCCSVRNSDQQRSIERKNHTVTSAKHNWRPKGRDLKNHIPSPLPPLNAVMLQLAVNDCLPLPQIRHILSPA